MAVVLVGMPASGKTSVGEHLAKDLRLPFRDVDRLIEQATGKLIREIFADDGEARFRELEVEATLAALEHPGIVSLGGGAVTSPAIRAALRGHAVFWLDVSVATATRRAGMSALRPLLLGDVRARMEALFAERRGLYEEVATHRVSVDRSSVAETAARIVALLDADRGRESHDTS